MHVESAQSARISLLCMCVYVSFSLPLHLSPLTRCSLVLSAFSQRAVFATTAFTGLAESRLMSLRWSGGSVIKSYLQGKPTEPSDCDTIEILSSLSFRQPVFRELMCERGLVAHIFMSDLCWLLEPQSIYRHRMSWMFSSLNRQKGGKGPQCQRKGIQRSGRDGVPPARAAVLSYHFL